MATDGDHGMSRNGRAATPITYSIKPRAVTADIVVCVHNALDDVTRCLASIGTWTDARHRLIVVDDASEAACRDELRRFAAASPAITLIRNEERQGYTKSANLGLRLSSAPLVVLLNSDTIVTPRWLERLIECAYSDPRIGIVGPLSNAATFQSIPEIRDAGGGWATNPLPDGWEPRHVADALATISPRAYPRAPQVNGFCFAIKRAVIDAIGYFDEDGFPDGYGEEIDYCFRAAKAGFELALADHAYVFHAKSRSYGSDRRRALVDAGMDVLERKHRSFRLRAAVRQMLDLPALDATRAELATILQSSTPLPGDPAGYPSALFLLPVSSVGRGGAHSVVQEAFGMRRLGVDAQVAVPAKYYATYARHYASMPSDLFYPFKSMNDLVRQAGQFDVVVGTIFTSLRFLEPIVAKHPGILPAYYVQDYEPWFFEAGTPEWEEATASYTRIPGMTLFAKTQWLCDIVRQRHGVDVHKVCPSLDRDLFCPPVISRPENAPIRLAAMVRPSTPRRGAARTMRVLERVRNEFGERVDIVIFGSDDEAIILHDLARDFPFDNRGPLVREQVADLLRETDVFVDFSDYQAFGRSGLEAMACGCAVVVPLAGGADEYAIDRENAIMVDTEHDDACFDAVRELLCDDGFRRRLRSAGLATAREHSIARAARSEVDLFRSRLCQPLASQMPFAFASTC
jgi:GT2 family glycosyltransferase/glycosyltransferase involved in cell wall biosynthesis